MIGWVNWVLRRLALPRKRPSAREVEIGQLQRKLYPRACVLCGHHCEPDWDWMQQRRRAHRLFVLLSRRREPPYGGASFIVCRLPSPV